MYNTKIKHHTDRRDVSEKRLYQKSRHGFTLVELIVTITIIAILGVIAFTAFNGYQSGARDSARTSDLTLIEQGLGISYTKQGTYPTPDNIFSVTYSGAQVWNQGTISTGVVQKLDSIGTKLSRKPTDPLYSTTEYTYSLLNTAKEYQLATVYEGTPPGLSYNNPFPLIPQAFAATNPVAYIKGNYNGVMAKVSTGSIIYVLAVPSIILADSGATNLALISSGSWVLSGKQNLPKSYQTAGLSLTGNLTFQPAGSGLVIYASGSLPTTNSGIIDLIRATQSSYTGTTIQNIPQIQNLLQPQSTTTLVDLWNGTLRTSLQATALTVTTIDNQPQTYTCSGTAPAPATGLTQSTTSPTDNITPYTYSASTTTTGPACTWKCDTGYTQNGNTCEVKLYVDDVFSTYVRDYSSASTQTVTTGIDIATNGGMIWAKERAVTGYDNWLVDSVRGIGNHLKTNSTAAQRVGDTFGVRSFTTTGFTTDNGGGATWDNSASGKHVFWTFRKAPKFFDVVTFTVGAGASGYTFNHALGVTPGMIILKSSSSNDGQGWLVWHKSLGDTKYLVLNSTAAAASYTVMQPTSTQVVIPNGNLAASTTYVAYIFADDQGADGIIQCGSTAGTKVTLGWEPQWIIHKSSNFVEDWSIIDTQRGMPFGAVAQKLVPNTSVAETTTSNSPKLYADGFELGAITGTHIYCAIRRPNKPVTDPTKVFTIKKFDSGVVGGMESGFIDDMAIFDTDRFNGAGMVQMYDRLRGIAFEGGTSRYLDTTLTTSEQTVTASYGAGLNTISNALLYGNNIHLSAGRNTSTTNGALGYFFKRAPGFFDQVAYTGNGSVRTINHNLGVAPELMFVKIRGTHTGGWLVYSAGIGNTKYLYLNGNGGQSDATIPNVWNSTNPNSTTFTIGDSGGVNLSGDTYIAYLFATLPNISKVGSYAGSASNVSVDCGFTSAPRFLLVKRTDSSTNGDWYVWDSARGFDKRLSLNTTAAEVTGDTSVTTSTSGFNATAGGVVNGGATANYIYLCVH